MRAERKAIVCPCGIRVISSAKKPSCDITLKKDSNGGALRIEGELLDHSLNAPPDSTMHQTPNSVDTPPSPNTLPRVLLALTS